MFGPKATENVQKAAEVSRMRTAQITAIFLVIAALASGCAKSAGSTSSTSSEPSAPPRMAVAAITVIDPSTDRWFTTEKLYLKVESSLEPGLAQLLPINVGRYQGETRVIHQTCFPLRPRSKETLTLEWRDDQTLTSEQRAVLVATIEEGGCLFVDGAQIIVTKRKPIPGLSASLRPAIRAAGNALVGTSDVRRFSSFGKADFHVPDEPADSFQAANVITVTYNKLAKAEVRFYYPPSVTR